jgi:hypothetical protein
MFRIPHPARAWPRGLQLKHTLKPWTVNDAQGFQTVVTLVNIDLTAKPDDSLFKIDEQRMIGQKR